MKTLSILFILFNIAACSMAPTSNRSYFERSKRQDFCRGVYEGYKRVKGRDAIAPYCPQVTYNRRMLNLTVYDGIQTGKNLAESL